MTVFFHSAAAHFLALLVGGTLLAPTQNSRTVLVRCWITDMFGRKVERAELTVYDTTASAMVHRTKEMEFHLRPGTYRLKVEAPGFRLETTTLSVDQESASVLVALKLGSFEGVDPRIRVAGRVSVPSRAGMWMRAVALFSNDSFIAPVDHQGKFDLGLLDAGRYLFILVADREAVCVEQHDVTGSTPAPTLGRCVIR